jgi:predicted nuclease of predicted toxin-antitoxin system
VRLLLDECVSALAAATLREPGYDVRRVVKGEGLAGDAEILDAALQEGRVLITLDKDFGELAVARGKRHVGIVRLVDFSYRVQAAECVAVLERYREQLSAGALIVASPGNVRVRLIRLLGDDEREPS